MVAFNTYTLLAVIFGALSVSSMPLVDEIEARSAQLSEALDARNAAYSEYETRQLEFAEIAQDLAARGYDVEHLLFGRALDKTFKADILAWLNQGSSKGAAQFGGNWAPMHSAGTATKPNCRPYGMTKKVEKPGPKKGNKNTKITVTEYYAKLECAPNSKKPDSKTSVVGATLIAGGEGIAAPTTDKVYAVFIAAVNAM